MSRVARTKQADMAEHPKEFDHVGLLVNEPPGSTGLLSSPSRPTESNAEPKPGWPATVPTTLPL